MSIQVLFKYLLGKCTIGITPLLRYNYALLVQFGFLYTLKINFTGSSFHTVKISSYIKQNTYI